MVLNTTVHKYVPGSNTLEQDLVAVEEPLEIRLVYEQAGQWKEQHLMVTMRTPGHDMELALGLLFAEGIIESYQDVYKVWHCERAEQPQNTVKIQLKSGIHPDLQKLERNFLSHSSCGVCGRKSIEDLEEAICYPLSIRQKYIPASIINTFSETLLSQQLTFRHTGGIHASALFDPTGKLHLLREDIGRHNSVDKLIGAMLAKEHIPLMHYILFLSSRISFELVQKALMAGIPVVAAVGAPSSLAITLANQHNLTLIGFVRDQRFNVYSVPQRIE